MSEYSVESTYNENVVEKINDMAKKRRRFNGKAIVQFLGLLFSIGGIFSLLKSNSITLKILPYFFYGIGVLVSVFSIYNDRYSLKKLFCGTMPSEDLKDRSKPNREIEFLNLLTNLDENEFSSLSNEAKNYFFVICSQQYNNYKLGGLDLLDNAFKFFIQKPIFSSLLSTNFFNDNFGNKYLNMLVEIQVEAFLKKYTQLKFRVELLKENVNNDNESIINMSNSLHMAGNSIYNLKKLTEISQIKDENSKIYNNFETINNQISEYEGILQQTSRWNLSQMEVHQRPIQNNFSNDENYL